MVLLHQKSNKHEPDYWRTIAMANPFYKLWTSSIAECSSRHVEHFDILSSSQDGFRK